MTVGQTLQARFMTLPNQDTDGDNHFDVRFPLRDAVVAYIHPEGRYITLETILDGKQVKESFHPDDFWRMTCRKST